MFFLALIFNLFSSYFIASIFGHFLIIFIAFFALVILNIEILSLFTAINELNAFIFSFFNFIVTFLVFKYKKSKFLKIDFSFIHLKNAFLLDKSLIFLFSSFLVMLFVSLFLALVVPVLEPDSQTYHFLRAYEFVSQGTLKHFDINDIRALIMPINSEIFYSWLLLFKKNFHGYGILSFCAFILVICSIWNIAEKFKFAYRKRLFAIFIFSSLASVIIQIPSLQTDLLVGSLLLSALALFAWDKIYFSSLALAIAMGTKSTGLIGLLGFFTLIILYEILIEQNKKLSKVKTFVLFLPINFLVFSSYNYFLNLAHFHNPISNRAAYLGHAFWGGFKGYISNLIHYFFQSFDFTGFKWGYYLNNHILELKEKLFEIIRIEPYIGCNVKQTYVNIFTDEQTMGFGILGFLVFLPMLIVSIFKVFFNKNKKTIFLSILALVFLVNILVLARSTAYMVYSIRFVLSFVVLSSPILFNAYSKKSILKPVIIFFCLFYMTLLPLHNKRMPFFKICNILSKFNFNLEKFENYSYEGKFIPVYITTPKTYETILSKYKDKKNIAYVKNLKSSALYLKKLEKQGYNIDFTPASLLKNEKINEYDLIILDDKKQNDNIFNSEEVKNTYKLEKNAIVFNSATDLHCYWINTINKRKTSPNDAIQRICFTYQYLIQNKNFKLDYSEKIKFKRNTGEEEINMYYFINQNKY